MRNEVEILLREETFLVVAKPPGLLVHRTSISSDQDSLMQRLQQMEQRRVYAVHRLDRATGGPLLVALNRETAAILGGFFLSGTIRKEYLAIVRGFLPETGTITHSLGKKTGTGEQAAITGYQCLDTTEIPMAVGPYASARYSLASIQPITGRFHQIRRHFAHIAHPVIGDTTHGDGRHNRFWREILKSPGLKLRCTSLAFPHPYTGHSICVSHSPEESWLRTQSEVFGVGPALSSASGHPNHFPWLPNGGSLL